MEKKLIRIQILLLVLITIVVGISGMSKGVWSDDVFLKMKSDGKVTTYYQKELPVVQVDMNKKTCAIFDEAQNSLDLKRSTLKNGDFTTLKLITPDDAKEWIFTYNYSTKEINGEVAPSNSFCIDMQTNFNFMFPHKNSPLVEMMLYKADFKFMGKIGDILLGLGLFVAGILIIVLKKSIILLDKFILGFFYKDVDKLKPSRFTDWGIPVAGLCISILSIIWLGIFILA